MWKLAYARTLLQLSELREMMTCFLDGPLVVIWGFFHWGVVLDGLNTDKWMSITFFSGRTGKTLCILRMFFKLLAVT